MAIEFSALAAALLIQARRAAGYDRKLRAMTARAAQLEDQLQGESLRRQAAEGLVLEAPPAAPHPLGSADSPCRLRSGRLIADVTAASVAPDGTRVAAIIGDEIRVWDAATGKLANQIRLENESPFSLTFSPDGCTLAVGVTLPQAEDRNRPIWGIRIIRSADEGHPAEFWGERFEGCHLVFSQDSRILASSRSDGVTLWNTTTGRPDLTVERRRSSTDSLALSPSGNQLAIGDGSGHLMLWDLATGKKIEPLQGHRRAIVSIDFSPDGSAVASGSLDHSVKVWDAATGRELASLHQESVVGCIDRVLAVRFSPTGATLVSAHLDRRVRFWETATFRLAGTSMLSPCNEDSQSGFLSMTLSQDRRSLVAIVPQATGVENRNGSKMIAVWDVLDLLSIRRHTPRGPY